MNRLQYRRWFTIMVGLTRGDLEQLNSFERMYILKNALKQGEL